MKEFLKGTAGVALSIVLIVALVFGLGYLGLSYKRTLGVAHADANREIFENTKTYVGGMADDLAKYKFELQTEKDPVAKQAIVEMIVSRFADFDANELKDSGLRTFLKDIRNGEYNQNLGGNE